jgi:hypothetical protein
MRKMNMSSSWWTFYLFWVVWWLEHVCQKGKRFCNRCLEENRFLFNLVLEDWSEYLCMITFLWSKTSCYFFQFYVHRLFEVNVRYPDKNILTLFFSLWSVWTCVMPQIYLSFSPYNCQPFSGIFEKLWTLIE